MVEFGKIKQTGEKMMQAGALATLPLFVHSAIDTQQSNQENNSVEQVAPADQQKDDSLLTDNEKHALEAGIGLSVGGLLVAQDAQRRTLMEPAKKFAKHASPIGFYTYAGGVSLITGLAIEIIENKL
jgi:hypothetical protein